MVSRLVVWLLIAAVSISMYLLNVIHYDLMHKAIWFSGATLVLHWFVNVLRGVKEFKPVNLPEDHRE